MARIDLPVTRVSRVVPLPLADPLSDPTNDYDMVNNGATIVLVQNVGGSSHNAQAVIEQTVDAQPVQILTYLIPANSTIPLGPYPVHIYGDHLLFNTDHVDLQIRAFSLL